MVKKWNNLSYFFKTLKKKQIWKRAETVHNGYFCKKISFLYHFFQFFMLFLFLWSPLMNFVGIFMIINKNMFKFKRHDNVNFYKSKATVARESLGVPQFLFKWTHNFVFYLNLNNFLKSYHFIFLCFIYLVSSLCWNNSEHSHIFSCSCKLLSISRHISAHLCCSWLQHSFKIKYFW